MKTQCSQNKQTNKQKTHKVIGESWQQLPVTVRRRKSGPGTKTRRGREWGSRGHETLYTKKKRKQTSQVPPLHLLTHSPASCTPHPSHQPPLLLHTPVFTTVSCWAHNECPIIQSSFHLKEKHPLKRKALASVEF